MRAWLAASMLVVATTAQSPTAQSPAAEAQVAASAAVAANDDWPALLAKFSPLDLDGDGTNEIDALASLGGAGAATAPCVVVCVEARLLASPATAPLADALRQRL